MSHFETVHEEDFAGFRITLSIAPEDEAPEWDFHTEEERDEAFRKINSGEWLWFVAKVSASRKGIELGTDYLGMCCYQSVQQFIQDAYYPAMIDVAVSAARETLSALCEEA